MTYNNPMKQIAAFPLAVLLALSPAVADNVDKPEVGEGLILMEEGAKLLLRGLLSEMEPALDDLQNLADEMGPAFEELQEMFGDLTNYHAPEVMPNGDIIIRRKAPLKQVPTLKDGEVEL